MYKVKAQIEVVCDNCNKFINNDVTDELETCSINHIENAIVLTKEILNDTIKKTQKHIIRRYLSEHFCCENCMEEYLERTGVYNKFIEDPTGGTIDDDGTPRLIGTL